MGRKEGRPAWFTRTRKRSHGEQDGTASAQSPRGGSAGLALGQEGSQIWLQQSVQAPYQKDTAKNNFLLLTYAAENEDGSS